MSLAQVLSNYIDDPSLRLVSREFRYYVKFPFEKIYLDDAWFESDKDLEHLIYVHDKQNIGLKFNKMTQTFMKKIINSRLLDYIISIDFSYSAIQITNDFLLTINLLSNLKKLKLEQLHIDNLSLSYLQDLRFLQELDLSNNKLSSTLYLSFINLSSLNLKNNKLSGLIFPSTLTYLNLKNNRINSIDFQGKTILQYLNLSKNYIQAIPSLCCLTDLRELKLENTYIKLESMINTFRYMPNLELLNLSNNGHIPADVHVLKTILGFLTNLQFLNLSKNYYGEQGLYAIAPELEKLIKLKYLDLSRVGLNSSLILL